MVADLMVADLMVDDLMVGDLMVPPFRMRRQSPLSPLARLRRSGSDQLAGFAAVAATNLPASPQHGHNQIADFAFVSQPQPCHR